MRTGLSELRSVLSGKFLKETSFPRQRPEERHSIDAVLFSLWARGQMHRAGTKTSILVLFSNLMGVVFWLSTLPRRIIQEFPLLLFSLAICYVTSFALSIPEFSQKFALALGIYALLQKEVLIHFIRCLAFDIGDILLLGGLTKRYIDWWERVGPTKSLSDPEFMSHLFISRLLLEGNDEKELSAAQVFFSEPANTSSQRLDAIERYWDEYPSNTQYWRSMQQP